MCFRERFCDHFTCKTEDFEKHFLFACLYRHAALLGRLFYYLDKRFFKDDLKLAAIAGVTLSRSELRREILNHRYENPPKGILHGTFRIRVSGRRIMDLAQTLFGGPPEPSSEIRTDQISRP
jgi:hypothetical protein